MFLTSVSIRRPLTMIMLILGMVIIGARFYNDMPLERFPTIDIPVVSVSVIWPGASPEDVEQQIVLKIEDALASIAGIDAIHGRAAENYGAVTLEFQDGVDGNAAAVDVQRQVATIKDFPDGSEQPQILKFDFSAMPIVQMVLEGPQSQDVLFDIAENTLKDQFQSVPGVASVAIAGGREREVQINIDAEKLSAYKLSLGQVQQAIAANNVTIPAGSLEIGRNKMNIRSVGEFNTLQELGDMVVAGSLKPDKDGRGGAGLVYLKDIATIRDSYKDRETVFRFNGRDAVSVNVVKTSDANTVALADEVKALVPKVNEKLPAGAVLNIIKDDSKFVRDSLDAVQSDLVSAVIITGIVILIFLHTVRNTFIVLMCLPASIISNFTIMYYFGFSLNGITLLALTLVIGILVDDSIVMLENIERRSTELKEPPKLAALNSASELALAVIATSLVLVVIYLPVAFMSGIVGQFLYSYGVTIASSVIVSTFVAFTLTPLLAAFLLDDHSKPKGEPKGLQKFLGKLLYYTIGWIWALFVRIWEAFFDLVIKTYTLTLRFSLANFLTQTLVIIISALTFGAGLWLVGSGLIPAEFIPSEDQGLVLIGIQLPPGTNLDTTDSVAAQIEQTILQEVPETVNILTTVGTSQGGGVGASAASNAGQVNITLLDKQQRERSAEDIVTALRPHMQKIPEASITLSAGEGAGPPGAALVVRLSGPEKTELIKLADQVEAIMKSVPNTTDIANNDAIQSAETRFIIDRERAKDLGLFPQEIAGTLRTALSGSKASDFDPPEGTKIDMTIRLQEQDRQNIDNLMSLPLKYNDGQPVTLDQVVSIERELAPAGITRFNRQLVLDVTSNVSGGAGVGDVTNDVETAIDAQIQFPVGYGYEFTGSAEFQREAFADLGAALALAIVLIYILLVALYQSFLQPMAIMFSLPVTLVGAFGGLYAFGHSLNLFSILGIILLSGVVTKNAILLIDFTNALREEGLDAKAALIEAGRLRLRAIFMTSFSLIFALLPMLLGQAAGAETRGPMAAVVIGGLVSSTFLTLVLVPVIYNFFDWSSGLTGRVLGAVWGTEDGPEGSSPETTPEKEPSSEPEKTPEPQGKPEPDPRPRQPTGPMPQPGSAMSPDVA
ncbi:efflux RND transporter permease subunit [Anaerolineales bacterium HSG6]|nr:efflux RND transporter permease subunit [Anaerolineales bacterium HSG6]MDM8532830.1 efflux RND transporter permease subunit [Anaerolineales bacterium HSG25]